MSKPSQKTIFQAITALEAAIAHPGAQDPQHGLCAVMADPVVIAGHGSAESLAEARELLAWTRLIWTAWPQYSREPGFPIPHPDKPGRQHAPWAFLDFDKWSGPYGASRLALAAWLVEQLKGALK